MSGLTDVLKKLWQNPMLFLKAAGAVLVVLFVLLFGLKLTQGIVGSLGLPGRGSFLLKGMPAGNSAVMHDEEMAADGAWTRGSVAQMAPESMPPPDGGFSTGDDAEDFEITEYSASYEVGDAEPVCGELAALKSRDDVIFEHASEHKTGCSYSFKVPRESANAVLGIISSLDPEDISTNTYTIQRSVETVTNEMEILEQKLESINATLESALAAYDGITQIATDAQDAGSLATVIDSKIRLIERLTQERIAVHQQLTRLEQNKARQLERLGYTYFHTSVREDRYIDGERLKDSWKDAIQSFVRDINSIAQSVTVGVALFLLYVVQYALYFFILLFVAKYGWKYARGIWKK